MTPRPRRSPAPVRGPLRRAFERGWRATDKDDRDPAAAELARVYADQLDQAHELYALAVAAAKEYREEQDHAAAAQTRKLADALAARQAVADLGPKFLAALAALNMTTAARATGKDGGKDEPADPAEVALGELGTRARKRDAAALDSPTTAADT
jgi:hypothetical protein